MNSKMIHSVNRFILLLLALVVAYPAAQMNSSAIAADIDNALKEIVTYKFGDSRENLSVVAGHVKATYGKPDELAKLEKKFTGILQSDTSLECKDFICRQLRIIGTKESVPVLAAMLTDKDTSDMARYALQNYQCPEAGRALNKALKKAEGLMLAGIINSLGERRDEECLDKLCEFVFTFENNDDNEEKGEESIINENITLAAINALGKIGGEKALKTLADVRRRGTPAVNHAAAAAILMSADKSAEDNK
ncbi:MAG: HEAT repeat domain-containing protein [Candidatus Latescibacteria bacterium]|nr:HEAT repeat domain-containing protein [Candidatus Latescibacterota bacterium]